MSREGFAGGFRLNRLVLLDILCIDIIVWEEIQILIEMNDIFNLSLWGGAILVLE